MLACQWFSVELQHVTANDFLLSFTFIGETGMLACQAHTILLYQALGLGLLKMHRLVMAVLKQHMWNLPALKFFGYTNPLRWQYDTYCYVNIYVGMKKGIQHYGKSVWHQTSSGLMLRHHWSSWALTMRFHLTIQNLCP